ncbi:hypothetical protein [Streptomyces sp. NBC_01237]|nr:hypothetical protein [Streptomyces sp. NBC_01237]WRZ74555.1 hypothetical protein OG251_24720 [Streptomyces sp. NBC_01237]
MAVSIIQTQSIDVRSIGVQDSGDADRSSDPSHATDPGRPTDPIG